MQHTLPLKRSVGAEDLLSTISKLMNLSSTEDLAREGINIISEKLGASHGKLLRRSNQNENKLEFWYGYSTEINFWDSEKRKKCNLDILAFSEQLQLPRNRRSIAGHVLGTNEVVILGNTSDPKYNEFFLDLGENVKSEIIAPITCEHMDLAFVLCLSSPIENHFREENKSNYLIFFNLLRILFDHIYTNESIESNYQFHEKLLRTKKQIDKYQVYDELMNALSERVGCEYCGLYTVSPDLNYIIKLGENTSKSSYNLFAGSWSSLNDLTINDTELKAFLTGKKRFKLCSKCDVLLYKISGYLRYSIDIEAVGLIVTSLSGKILNRGSFKTEMIPTYEATIEAFYDILLRKFSNAINRAEDAIRAINEEDLKGVHGPVGALEKVIERTEYKGIHIWIRERSRLRLVVPQMLYRKNFTVKLKDECLVTNAYHSKNIKYHYGLRGEKVRLIYPEIIPSGAESWLGYPIMVKNETNYVKGIISCFDRNEAGGSGLLSIIDLPIMGFLSAIITLGLELEKAKSLKAGKKSISSHEINLLLACLNANIYSLYSQAEGNIFDFSKVISERPEVFEMRSPQTLLENTQSFISGLKVAFYRDSVISGNYRISKSRVKLIKCVASTVSMYRTMLRRRSWYKKMVKVEYEDIFGTFNIDQSALQEVLINLLSNATKYSENGGLVTIRYPEKGVLLICNKGIGIPYGEEDLIFQLGYQGSNAGQANIEATGPGDGYRDKGVGLFISKTLMRAMGGDLILEAPGCDEESDTIFAIDIGKQNHCDKE